MAFGFVIPALDNALKPIAKWCKARSGLYVISGRSDSGRTTTLAMLLETYGQQSSGRVLTIDDPIEFLHPHGRSTYDQMERGEGFSTAVRSGRS